MPNRLEMYLSRGTARRRYQITPDFTSLNTPAEGFSMERTRIS